MDDLYIGPQAEVLEKIANFNNNYCRGNNELFLGVTPKFRWKPGSYDKVKDILSNVWLRWNMRPSGMNSIFTREQTYTKGRLKEALLEIETILCRFRNEGRVFVTDRTVITESFNILKNKLLEETDKISKIHENVSLQILNADDEFSQHIIELVLPIEDIVIKVKVGGRNRAGDERDIGDIPFGDIKLRFRMPLSKWFNVLYNNLESNTLDGISLPTNLLTHHSNGRGNFTCNAEIYPKHMGLRHPYVSTYRQGYGAAGNNVCMGEMMRDIIGCFLKLDWTSMIYWIDTWLSTYKVGVTGPLNDMRYASIGKQTILLDGKDNSEDYYSVVAPPSTGSCWDTQYEWIRGRHPERDQISNISAEVIKQCDEINCQLKSECSGYKANTIDIALQLKLDKFVSDNCLFEILMPNQQEYEEECIYYQNILSDSVFPISNNIRIPWELIQEAIKNKSFPIVSKLFEFMINENIVTIVDDDPLWEDIIGEVINGDKHEDICQALTELMGKPEPITDEQNDMLDWVAAMRQ
tara:strand:+ start:4674 stop:6242 length:1569 start_codon:yes stop_codon:yes gene_type:complete